MQSMYSRYFKPILTNVKIKHCILNEDELYFYQNMQLKLMDEFQFCVKITLYLGSKITEAWKCSLEYTVIWSYPDYIPSAGSARGVMVIVVGNWHGDTSSNPGRDWLHFT